MYCIDIWHSPGACVVLANSVGIFYLAFTFKIACLSGWHWTTQYFFFPSQLTVLILDDDENLLLWHSCWMYIENCLAQTPVAIYMLSQTGVAYERGCFRLLKSYICINDSVVQLLQGLLLNLMFPWRQQSVLAFVNGSGRIMHVSVIANGSIVVCCQWRFVHNGMIFVSILEIIMKPCSSFSWR